MGYSPWGCKELDTTKLATLSPSDRDINVTAVLLSFIAFHSLNLTMLEEEHVPVLYGGGTDRIVMFPKE